EDRRRQNDNDDRKTTTTGTRGDNSMHISFTGRRVVICGGSRGIGRSIALGFAAAGAHVSICARGADRLRQTAEELRNLGSPVHEATCDLADGDAVVDYVEAAAEALG